MKSFRHIIAFFRGRTAVPIFLMTVAFSMALSGVATGKTIYVSRTATGANNGTSWGNAYTALTTAIAAANSGDQVWIATGTYRPNDANPSNLSQAQSFQLKNGVSVYGGFAGTETSLAQRSAGTNPVILSGDLLGNDSAANTLGKQSSAATTTDNAYSVISNPASLALTSTALLDSVTIRGGNNKNNTGGGGMYNISCSPKITNCTFTDNNAGEGGAIYNAGSSAPTFINCTFAYNSATYGSAVAGIGGSPVFINCTFANNTAGAINTEDGPPTLTNCIFWANGNGTQIASTATVSHCVVQGGYAGTANLSSNPLLLPLAYYGGQTPTMPIAAGSPAIGAGLTGGSIPSTDQRGINRGSPPCIGACELSSIPLVAIASSQQNSTVFVTGYQPSLIVLSEGKNLSYQWYVGTAGNTSDPIAGATSSSLVLPALTAATNIWVKVSYPGGSVNSNTLSFTVGLPVVYLSTSGTDTNDGSTWASAKRTFQAAIGATGYGGQVWIATGTYRPNDANPSDLDRTQTFQLKNGVAVYGGFAGTETSLSQRNPAGNPVTMSGDLMGNDSGANQLGVISSAASTADNAYNVFYNPASLALDSSAVLDSVIIRGGNANLGATVGSNGSCGGGMYNDTCGPTISNCTFTDNYASGYGGAFYVQAGSPVLFNCTFAYNTAVQNGSAIYSPNSTFTVTNCTIAHNVGGAYAVAVTASGNLAMTNCILWLDSGASEIYSEDITVTNCILQGGFPGNLSSDPLLLPLGYYGGQTPTMPVSAQSPAVGAGVANALTPTLDQRGLARGSPPCIGACELSPAPIAAFAYSQQKTTLYAPGFQPGLSVLCEGTGLSYQWYAGNSGDTSSPITGGNSSSVVLSALTGNTSAWVNVSNSGTSVNSNTLALMVSPAVIHLSTGGSDTNDGSSWAAAKRTFQAAIGAAGYGGQVWIATGTYRPNDANPSNLDPTQTFQLKNGVGVYGGFAGTETALSQRNPAGNPVTMSGDLLGNDSGANQLGVISGTDTTSDNAYNVFYNSYALQLDSTATLDSVIIRGGNANNPGGDNNGGGIFNDTCSPTISNCTFTDNQGTYGAAICNSNFCSPTFVNCTIAFNSSGFCCGFTNFNAATPAYINCTIASNTASGGVVMYAYGPYTLLNCIVFGNTVTNVSSGASDVSGTNCIIQGGFPGTNILTSDPLLQPFGYYGGQTPTMPLSAGSPAIQAGLANGSVPATDQRGLPRTSPPDIGACEYQSAGYISPAQFVAPPAITPGGTASTTVYTEGLASPTYQWYSGTAGDTSQPISGATGSSFTTPALEVGADYWVAITSGGSVYDSPTWSVPVDAPVPAAPAWALIAAGAGLLIAACRRREKLKAEIDW